MRWSTPPDPMASAARSRRGAAPAVVRPRAPHLTPRSGSSPNDGSANQADASRTARRVDATIAAARHGVGAAGSAGERGSTMGMRKRARRERRAGGRVERTGLAVDGGVGVVSAHRPGTNGCTLSPDSGYAPVYYNFHDACDAHDICYGTKPYGDTQRRAIGVRQRLPGGDAALVRQPLLGVVAGAAAFQLLRRRRGLLPGRAHLGRAVLLERHS